MTDFATLRLGAETGELKRATTDIDKVAKSADRAEDSSAKLSAGLRKAALAAGVFAASFVSAQAAMASITQARGFSAALGETSTLIEGTAAELEALEKNARSMAATFGGTATGQVQAFYQAISAGAGSVEDAATLLDSANKLAIGGVTDVTTSVDALTTATNAYAATGLTAANASDAFFVAIKAGKTTAAELGAALGNVVPIASSLGVSLDQVLSATAALTTQGQSTSVAITGLRQVMAGVLKPTSEATKLAEKLGLEFNTSALRAKGLAGFLADVTAKTGGSQDAMAQLFGSVEALNAVLALSGAGGDKFSEILGQMESKAGATDAAFNKIALTLDQRLNVLMGQASNATLTVGNTLLAVLVPALETAASGMALLANNSDILAVALIGLAATAIPRTVTALAGMVTSLTAGATATGILTSAMGALRVAVALAGGPWGILAGLIAAAASYFLVFRDNSKLAAEGAYDAEAGTIALNKALGNFTNTTAPAAGAAAINVANDNYKLADSAYEVAKAELAKAQAFLASQTQTQSGRNLRTAQVAANVAAENLASAERDLNQAMAERRRTVTAVTGATYTMTDATNAAGSSITNLGEASAATGKTLDEIFVAALEKLAFEKDLIGRTAREVEILTAQEQLRGQLLGRATELNLAGNAKVIAGIEDQVAAYGILIGEVVDLTEAEDQRLKDAERASRAIEDQIEEQARLIENLADDLATSFTNFFASGFSSFKNFANDILASFKNLIFDMVQTAARNQIIIALGAGGVVGSAGAASAGGSGGGILGQGIGIASKLGGLSGAFLGGAGASLGFLGSSLGFGAAGGAAGLAGGGIGAAAGLSSVFAGATSSVAGFAAAAGAVAGPLAIAALAVFGVVKFFSTKKKELDRGIVITADAAGSMVEQFKVIKKTKFFGLSKKISTDLEQASEELSNPIVKAVSEIQSQIMATASTLGVGSEAFESFAASIKIQTKDLSEDEIAQRLTEEITNLGNAFAGMVPGVQQLAREGEGFADTLTRLSDVLTIANSGIGALNSVYNLTPFAGDIWGAGGAQMLAERVGGAGNLAAGFQGYIESILTTDQQLKIVGDSLESAFASVGQKVPKTLEEFGSMFQGAINSLYIDGAATLLQIAPTFRAFIDQTAQAADDLAAALQRARDAALSLVDGYEFATAYDERRARLDAEAGRDVYSAYLQPNIGMNRTQDDLSKLREDFKLLASTMRIVAANTGRTASATEDSLGISQA